MPHVIGHGRYGREVYPGSSGPPGPPGPPGPSSPLELFYGAADGWSSLTNGAQSTQQIETTPGNNNKYVVNFDPGAQTFFEWEDVLPGDFSGTTCTFRAYWYTTSASGNSVVWGVSVVAVADGQSNDVAYAAGVEVTDANTGANQENISTLSAAVTITGSPGAGAKIYIRVYRLGSGSDTLAAVARLESLGIFY